ncbi:hypothetical protein [Clostridium paraputrificum]|uniref:Uncharacterized protein n=1 Tax=Clostridium paraputrificum TaxID=29363 RepID=A0A6N3F336_9CLOT
MECKRDKFSLDIKSIRVFKSSSSRRPSNLYATIDWDCLGLTQVKFETTLVKALHRYIADSEFIDFNGDNIIYLVEGERKEEFMLHVIQKIKYAAMQKTACQLKTITIINKVFDYMSSRMRCH